MFLKLFVVLDSQYNKQNTMTEKPLHINRKELSHITHELKNPIAAIELFTDMLLKGIAGPLSQKQQSMLKEIHTSNKKLTDLIEAFRKNHLDH